MKNLILLILLLPTFLLKAANSAPTIFNTKRSLELIKGLQEAAASSCNQHNPEAVKAVQGIAQATDILSSAEESVIKNLRFTRDYGPSNPRFTRKGEKRKERLQRLAKGRVNYLASKNFTPLSEITQEDAYFCQRMASRYEDRKRGFEQEEMIDFNMAPEDLLPNTCAICEESFDFSTGHCEYVTMPCCSNTFHYSCLRAHWNQELNNNLHELSCPECSKTIPLEKVNQYLKIGCPEMIHLVQNIIRSRDDMALCSKCNNSVIFPKGKYWTQQCPTCHEVNCPKCDASHSGYTCEEYIKQKDLQKKVDELSQEVPRKTIGCCPFCHNIIIKHSGCSLMICGRNYHGKKKQ